MLKLPKISCLTVTNGRLEFLRRSVLCYSRQTYPHKELIVVSQGSTNQAIQDYLDSLGRTDILFISVSPGLCLGAMRNLSVELATGEFVCQWDDDDLYDPLRLVTQYHALLGHGISASLYCEHLKYFAASGELYWIDWSVEAVEHRRYLCGTVMFPKRIFHAAGSLLYPETGRKCKVEEDWHVLEHLTKHGRIAPIHQGNQYLYVYHGENVYGKRHHELVFQKRVLKVRELLDKQEIILRTLRQLPLFGSIKVSGFDGVAFEHFAKECE